MNEAQNEKTMRIALVLREATVLDQTHWESFVKTSGLAGEKSLMQIFKSDATTGLAELLFKMDVFTLKIPARSAEPSAVAKALSSPVTITSQEVTEILKRCQPDVAKLCHALIVRELLTTEALEKALDAADKGAHNVYDVLVSQGIITPEIIAKAVESPRTDIGIENRVLLACDMLAYNNLITRGDLTRALESRAVTHAPLSTTLADLGILTQDDLVQSLSQGLELPVVDLAGYDLSADLVELFPGDFMRRQMFVPLSVQDRLMEIGTADPFNLALIDTISLLTGRRVQAVFAPHQELLSKFGSLFPQAAGEDRVTALPSSTAPRVIAPQKPAAGTSGYSDSGAKAPAGTVTHPTEHFVDNLSTVQVVSQIIDSAVSARATDIHIEPLLDSIRVRYRVDGRLHNVMKIPAEMLTSVVSRIKVLSGMNVTERRRPQDGHLSFETANGAYDFRISSLPSAYGEKLVLRVLDSSRVMTGLTEIGLLDDQLEVLEWLVVRPHGMVLVTGPTGSGKTSTLYACLSTVNREDVNIISIEDPVEYMLPGITQVQVDSTIDMGFAEGLRSALRQDPDVIMVGEIRDAETAHTAVRAAMTGHLVFSTLHTNTAIGAVNALSHLGVDDFAIAAGLSGIISQRLVRCIDPDAKEAYKPSKEDLLALGLPASTKKKFWRGLPTDDNLGTGYKGRTGIFEVVEVKGELRKAIGAKATDSALTDIARKGNRSLMDAGLEKIFQGKTTVEEVLRAVAID